MNEDSFIFHADRKKQSQKLSGESKFYTLVGMHDGVDEDSNYIVNNDNKNTVFAKRTYDPNGKQKFYIRLANSGNIYNPISVYGEEKTNTFLDRVCKDTIRYREVNKKAFDMYLKFLGSKNIAWLHNTEREII